MAASPEKATRVLCHPLRAKIFESLNEVSASATQLAETFDTDLNRVVYHVSVLAEAGVIRPVEAAAGRRAAGRVYEPAPAR